MITESDHSSEGDLLRAWLASHDVECPVCRYNLRATVTRTCPECGAHLRLRAGSSDLRLGAWIVALLGVALPLGFVGIYLILWIVRPLVAGGGVGWAALRIGGLLPASMMGIYVGMLVLLIRRRHRFWKRPRRTQWCLTACVLVASLAVLLGGPLLLVFILDASGVI